MKKSLTVLLLLIAPLLLVSCAGSASSNRERGSTYRSSLGTLPNADMKRILNEAMLLRYNYSINRNVDTPEDYLLETSWRDVAAFPDEQLLGYGFNRTRVTFTAKPANRMGGALGSYRVNMFVESQVRRVDSNVWEDAPMSEERYEYVREIANYLKDEFRTTFRNQ